MTFRILPLAAAVICGLLDPAQAAPQVSPAQARMSAYRRYAKAQADTLVGMTRILAEDIRDGDLDAARMSYAPAHGYLVRLAPIAAALRDPDRAMDASAAPQADRVDAGFHRIEYGLFANRSTKDSSKKDSADRDLADRNLADKDLADKDLADKNLAAAADRLDADARTLREQLARRDVTPATLLDRTIAHLDAMADGALAGTAEPYARADLWDVEATLDGARHVVAVLDVALQDATTRAAVDLRFAQIDALLEAHKDGCGYQSYALLGRDDRMALRTPLAALAMALARLRGTASID